MAIPVRLGLVRDGWHCAFADERSLGPDGRLHARPGQRQHHLRECRRKRPLRPVPRFLRTGESGPRPVERRIAGAAAARHAMPFNRWQSAQSVALRLLVRLSKGERGRRYGDRTALTSALGGFHRARCVAGSGFRRARADAAERGRDRTGDRPRTWIPMRSTRRASALRRHIAEDNAGTLREALRRPRGCAAPTARMRRAPGDALCATSRSTSWPPPIRLSAKHLPGAQFDERRPT